MRAAVLLGNRASAADIAYASYDFETTLARGTTADVLGGPPDAWPGRALLEWTDRVRARSGCGEIEHLATTAQIIQGIYGR